MGSLDTEVVAGEGEQVDEGPEDEGDEEGRWPGGEQAQGKVFNPAQCFSLTFELTRSMNVEKLCN